MGRSRFEALLPGGAAHAAVCALARFAADDAVEIEVRLLLAAEEVPPTVLGAPLCGGLGRGSWLSTRAPACAPEDVTFVIA
jgi:predicted component of type VI protein secretion system